MLVSPTPTSHNSYYYQTLQQRFDQALQQVKTRPLPQIQERLPAFLTLLERARSLPYLHATAVDLILALHPWPKRWGFISQWAPVLHFAIATCQQLNRPRQAADLAADLAELLMDGGNFDEAIKMGHTAVALCQQYHFAQPMAWAAFFICQALVSTGRIQQAADFFAQLKQSMPTAVDPTEQQTSQILLTLVESRLLRRQGKLPTAVALLQPLVQQLHQLPQLDNQIKARIYTAYSFQLIEMDRFDEPATYLQQAIALYEEMGDIYQLQVTRADSAYLYNNIGQFAEAEMRLLTAVHYFEKAHLYFQLVEYIGSLATLYMIYGKLQKATPYFQQQISLAQQIGYESSLSLAYVNYSATLLLQGEFAASLDYLEKGLVYYRRQNRENMLLHSQLGQSYAYWGLGRWAEGKALAENVLQQGLTQYAAQPYLSLLARRCLALFCPPEEAITLLQTAVGQAQQIHSWLQEAACLLSLSGLVADPAQRQQLWQAGSHLLAEHDAIDWLIGHSPQNPPFIGMFH